MTEEQYKEFKQWLERQVAYWNHVRPLKAEAFNEALGRLNAIRHNWPRS